MVRVSQQKHSVKVRGTSWLRSIKIQMLITSLWQEPKLDYTLIHHLESTPLLSLLALNIGIGCKSWGAESSNLDNSWGYWADRAEAHIKVCEIITGIIENGPTCLDLMGVFPGNPQAPRAVQIHNSSNQQWPTRPKSASLKWTACWLLNSPLLVET